MRDDAMRYSKLVETYEYLEGTSARLKKTDAIAKLLKETDSENLSRVALLLQGRVFPAWDERKIGIASQSMEKIVSLATGFPEKEVGARFKKTGDFGLVVEELAGKKKQKTLFEKSLTVGKVFENLQKLASVGGKGSQERKFKLVSELIVSAKPKEAKYIVRTTVGDLRIGVAQGVVRDAIAKAFLPMDTKEKAKQAINAVEWAWFLRPDYAEVAKIARKKGLRGLKNVKLEVGKPYHVLLAEKSPGLKEALESFERPALEFKYDGARILIHKKGKQLWFYTRRMENITKQFPELADFIRKGVKARECIIEGEMLGFNKKTGKPMPFQFLSQRIRRKYDIEKMVKEIPIQVNLFDITYLNGKSLFDTPLGERRRILEKVIKPIKGKFQLARQLITKELKKAEDFYREALRASQEGLIVKNLDALYQPGRRVAGGWLKVKPTLETLDLAIIGATWGMGKRAGWLGSYIIGCRDTKTGKFLECGMIGTGIKEKRESGGVTFQELTRLLKPHITSEKRNRVKIKPKVIVEVAYEEIQRSPNYSSGWALRFPRVLRLRPDKNIGDVDDLKRIEKISRIQKGKR
jgi:DNA ligase-1